MRVWSKLFFLVTFIVFFSLHGLGETLAELNKVPVPELLERAESGDAFAQYNAGLRYFWGNRGVERDSDEAAKWFQKASDQGHVEAQQNMGRMMVLGWGFDKDVDGGLAVLRDAAEKGSGGACWVIGDLYERGAHGVSKDFEKAELWYQKGADLGHGKSLDCLGKLGNEGVEVSEKKLVSRSKSAEAKSLKENLLLEGSDLKMKIERERLSKNECEQEGFKEGDKGETHIEHDGYRYALELKNVSDGELKNIKVSCRCYYTEEEHWVAGGGIVGRQAVRREEKLLRKSDNLEFDSIDPKGRIKETAGPFVLTSTSLRRGYYYTNGKADEVTSRLEGLWVRVSYMSSDGQGFRQDFYEPESLKSKVLGR